MRRKNPWQIMLTTLLFLNAFVWLGFAIIVAAGWHPAMPEDQTVRIVMAALSAGAGLTLLGLTWLLRRGSRLAYFAAIGVLLALAVVTILDQVGLADIGVLLLTLAPVALLIWGRRWHLSAGP